jgi:tripartite-type tricarboxylate transporter receptor subunit TctC
VFNLPASLVRILAGIGLASALAAPAAAQPADYPSKPITFVVPFGPGSATDQMARAVAQGITKDTGTQVLVENRVGAAGFLAAQAVARAQPDGYTVFVTTNTTHAANEHLFNKLPYDPVKDFEPVTALNKGSQIMIFNNAIPAKTVAEFIALAKKNPGKYTFGSGSSSSRLAVELFQQMAGIQLLHIPYKSSPQAITDLIAGQLDMMIVDAPNSLAQMKVGRVRGVAVSGAKRNPLAPELPTIAEAGVKGYDMSYWTAAYVPARTPPAVVRKLNELMIKATSSDAARQFYESTGSEHFTSTPAELARFQAAETQKWGAIVKAASIQKE